jgi:hypothetical protein
MVPSQTQMWNNRNWKPIGRKHSFVFCFRDFRLFLSWRMLNIVEKIGGDKLLLCLSWCELIIHSVDVCGFSVETRHRNWRQSRTASSPTTEVRAHRSINQFDSPTAPLRLPIEKDPVTKRQLFLLILLFWGNKSCARVDDGHHQLWYQNAF